MENLLSNETFIAFLKKLGFKKYHARFRVFYSKKYRHKDYDSGIPGSIDIEIEEDENGEYVSIQPIYPKMIDNFDAKTIGIMQVTRHSEALEDILLNMKLDLLKLAAKIREIEDQTD